MALSSMTGFARADGVSGSYAWAWEIKSVNAKGLELRLRVPPGWDAIEAPLRARVAEALGRGTINANLTVQRAGVAPVVRVNEPVLGGGSLHHEGCREAHRRGAAARSTAFSGSRA